MKRGDFIRVTGGDHQNTIDAMVVLASENEDSLMIMFDAFFMGYLVMMPLLREGGVYRDLLEMREVKVEAIER